MTTSVDNHREYGLIIIIIFANKNKNSVTDTNAENKILNSLYGTKCVNYAYIKFIHVCGDIKQTKNVL